MFCIVRSKKDGLRYQLVDFGGSCKHMCFLWVFLFAVSQLSASRLFP